MSSKRDLFHMNTQQAQIGREMWKRTGQKGRLASSSFDAEANAPKTWIQYVNGKGEEIGVVECELYVVGRTSGAEEQVAMLHGMCPKCGETFIAREDNKTMSIEKVTYREAPKWMKVHWQYHCRNVLHRPFSESDKMVVVSSPERWACDYCRGWVVRVNAGVARDDHSGVTQFSVPANVKIIDPGPKKTGTIEF